MLLPLPVSNQTFMYREFVDTLQNLIRFLVQTAKLELDAAFTGTRAVYWIHINPPLPTNFEVDYAAGVKERSRDRPYIQVEFNKRGGQY